LEFLWRFEEKERIERVVEVAALSGCCPDMRGSGIREPIIEQLPSAWVPLLIHVLLFGRVAQAQQQAAAHQQPVEM
jgi:hypothetical protein